MIVYKANYHVQRRRRIAVIAVAAMLAVTVLALVAGNGGLADYYASTLDDIITRIGIGSDAANSLRGQP